MRWIKQWKLERKGTKIIFYSKICKLLRVVITKGGEEGSKMAIFDYVQYWNLQVAHGSNHKGEGVQKTTNLDYVIHGWPLSKCLATKAWNRVEVALMKSKSAVHVRLSRFYPDFILILSRFFRNSLYPNFIQILS